MSERQLAPIEEKRALREIGEAAVRSRGSACHLRPWLLLLVASHLGTLVGSNLRRGWFGRLANTQQLGGYRRGRRGPKRLGYGRRSCLRFVGWRFEIHTQGKEQQGQRRAHIEKVLEERHRTNKKG